MKIPLTYGTWMALGGAALTLVLYLAGFHDNPEKMSVAQWVGTAGGIALGVTCLSMAMRAKRAAFPANAEWGYGSALGVGVLTGLVASILGAVFAYVYFSYINPDMPEVIFRMQLAKMEANNMSAAQIERAEPIMRKWMSAGMMTGMQACFGFIWSVILSLIIAIFFRHRPATVAAEQPPALG